MLFWRIQTCICVILDLVLNLLKVLFYNILLAYYKAILRVFSKNMSYFP